MSAHERLKRNILPTTAVLGSLGYAAYTKFQQRRDSVTKSEMLKAALEEQARMKEEMKKHRDEARHDPLTGLLNRLGIDERFKALTKLRLDHHRRDGEAKAAENINVHSVILLDLDFFKSLNDGYGHGVGDVGLKNAANAIRERIRDTDEAARVGGEEFAILLPHTSKTGAYKFAEDLRKSIGGEEFVTASLGIAEFDRDKEPSLSLDAILQRADEALYAAKGNGRNQSVHYSSLNPERPQ